ncbi:hypothetical protein O0L34_g6724 [Tuta absoluta]|nr:hypothetical protein O0L34_g6724 [Tuta absoluta]
MKAANIIKSFRLLPVNNVNLCCLRTAAKVQVRYSASVGFMNHNIFAPVALHIRNLGLGPTSKEFEEGSSGQRQGPLTKAHATELVLHLNDDERIILYNALQEYKSNKIKEEFEEMLAGGRWRTKLGRPSKVPTLGDVDPTGTYCPVPDDWFKKKYAATVPKPSSKELFHLFVSNSIPFIGFGFLDNFIMLVAGDRIESGLGSIITISTMAAAAWGNTFSDVIGIGSSYYVERAANLLGLGAPKLSPVQLDMPVSRRAANLGRVLGITLGCILGMIPLLFRDGVEKKPDEEVTVAVAVAGA